MRGRWLWMPIVAALLALSGCGGGASERVVITEAGSTTVQPLAERLAEVYMATHPGVEIIVQGGGSSVGIKSVGEGTVDVGGCIAGD